MKVPFYYLGPDPEPYEEPEFWLTDEGECSECGADLSERIYELDLTEVPAFFVIEESGVSPDTPDGPAVHWASGYLVCPGCKAQLPYETSN